MPWRTRFWIALKRVDGVFKWSDDTEARLQTYVVSGYNSTVYEGTKSIEFQLAKGDYQPWAEGYPKEDAGDCVYMALHNRLSLAWFNIDCNTDLDYACQVDPCDTDHYCNGQDI
ncbi:hypothetical protein OESDEN_00927 [Oesophagostomum dentatum]|uniref:C-type lectin domain-containing protein n=1 Tax=Oesophagostomum dentatum TaxID=61180 RepID=A0A0B1TNJ7_OESDE|nr:hypothetical protein OESDEN_00927 [Oesophagostomum dentatum]